MNKINSIAISSMMHNGGENRKIGDGLLDFDPLMNSLSLFGP